MPEKGQLERRWQEVWKRRRKERMKERERTKIWLRRLDSA
jgi:hypothetical protein